MVLKKINKLAVFFICCFLYQMSYSSEDKQSSIDENSPYFNPNETNYLQNLPPEIINVILNGLSIKDRYALSNVNHYFKNMLKQTFINITEKFFGGDEETYRQHIKNSKIPSRPEYISTNSEDFDMLTTCAYRRASSNEYLRNMKSADDLCQQTLERNNEKWPFLALRAIEILDNNKIILGCIDGSIEIWNFSKPRDEQCILKLSKDKEQAHEMEIDEVKTLDNNRFISIGVAYFDFFSSTSITDAKIWDITKEEGSRCTETKRMMMGDAVHRLLRVQDNLLAFHLKNGEVELWDIASSRINSPFKKFEAGRRLSSYICLHNGWLVTEDADYNLKIWNFSNIDHIHCVKTLIVNSSHDVVFMIQLRDKRLVTASHDGIIKVWDLQREKDECLIVLQGEEGYVQYLKELSNGLLISTATNNKNVDALPDKANIWDLKKRHDQCIHTLPFAIDISGFIIQLVDSRLIVHRGWTSKSFEVYDLSESKGHELIATITVSGFGFRLKEWSHNRLCIFFSRPFGNKILIRDLNDLR